MRSDRGGDRRHRDARRIAQHVRGEIGDLARHGGGEQQRLALLRELRDDRADVVDEAHVEHAVGFVEHEHFDLVEAHAVLLHQVEQAAGRRDQHVEAVHQVAHLPSHRDAADHERGLDAHVAAVGAEAFEDLAGQFARRAEHQHARALLFQRLPVVGEPVEDRERERGGLAGAGLRDADEVAAGEDQRDGVGLDRGGGGVLLLSKGTRDRLCEAEVVEGVQNITVLLWRGARRNGGACRGVVVDTPPGLGCQCDWRYRRAGRNLAGISSKVSYRRPCRRPESGPTRRR